MTEEEKTAEEVTNEEKARNNRRVIELQDIIPALGKELLDLESKEKRAEAEFSDVDGIVDRLSAELEKAVDDLETLRETVFSSRGGAAEKRREREERLAELETLLKPYDDVIAALEAKVKGIEDEFFKNLKEAAFTPVLSDEYCRKVAKDYADSTPEAFELVNKRDTIQKLRACRMGKNPEWSYSDPLIRPL